MAQTRKKKTTNRTVAIPVDLDRKIKKAAEIERRSIQSLILVGAEHYADDVLDREKKRS